MVNKITTAPTDNTVVNKINEVIDAVNYQQIQLNNLECRLLDLRRRITVLDDPTYHEEPTDPYAEQRKWIGKLCRCWDSDINDDIWGILQDIKDNKTEKYYLYGIGYEHCEPVKPDDDIIYKGVSAMYRWYFKPKNIKKIGICALGQYNKQNALGRELP